ncbi:MAG: hypothetical protein ACTILK_02630, partial [Bifidobacterium crudilactis]|uniref:hypothetical protein n=1 Tax=Bifidobacterium crudilactis TaxID=327277 RepID=UPI003F985A20
LLTSPSQSAQRFGLNGSAFAGAHRAYGMPTGHPLLAARPLRLLTSPDFRKSRVSHHDVWRSLRDPFQSLQRLTSRP